MDEKKSIKPEDMKSFFKKNPGMAEMFKSCMANGEFACDGQKIMGSMMKNCCRTSQETKSTGQCGC